MELELPHGSALLEVCGSVGADGHWTMNPKYPQVRLMETTDSGQFLDVFLLALPTLFLRTYTVIHVTEF